MYRYFALAWDRRDRDAAAEAQAFETRLLGASRRAWRRVWREEGVCVFDAGARPGATGAIRLAGGAGVVLGRLFRNDNSPVDGALDDAASQSILRSAGQTLIDRYWGRYVALLHDAPAGALHVVRDPTGALPCLATSHGRLRLFFSDMQDAADLECLALSVNWRYVAANFLTPQLQKTETGLNEVREALPGECWSMSPDGDSRRFLWNPFAIAADGLDAGAGPAAQMLREKIAGAAGALSRGCAVAAVCLGGLDSSIALACLAASPSKPRLVALNYFTPSPLGDERFYSRQAARRYGAPLAEIELDPGADLSRLLASNRLASPPGMFDCIGLSSPPSRVVADHGAGALFTGIGGDNVFCQPAYNFSALDYARERGPDAGFLSAILYASRYGRASFARTCADVMRELVRPAPCGPYVLCRLFGPNAPAFVRPEFLAACDARAMLHPLLVARDGDLKAKYLQILSCAFFAVDYYDHWDTDYSAERIHLFLQQPVIETCLRIPSWIMTSGGVDRALARMAFADLLPGDVARRLGKSTPAPYYEGLCRNNIGFVRSVLLDGTLSKAGVIDRAALEQALNGDVRFLAPRSYDILNLVSVECWARGWNERRMRKQAQDAA